MNPTIRKIASILSLIASLVTPMASFASTSYRVDTSAVVNVFSICRQVNNGNADDLFVPAGTTAEWQSLVDKGSFNNITIASCTPGCTDPDAENYSAAANVDDGSCSYECEAGSAGDQCRCEESGDFWYGNSCNSCAEGDPDCDDGGFDCGNNGECEDGQNCETYHDDYGVPLSSSCVWGSSNGCSGNSQIDELGNYAEDCSVNGEVCCESGGNAYCSTSCAPANLEGCTDSGAENYDSEATYDNGSCVYSCPSGETYDNETSSCQGMCPEGEYLLESGVCSGSVVYGCTDSGATNYSSSATQDDGTCTYACPAGQSMNGDGQCVAEYMCWDGSLTTNLGACPCSGSQGESCESSANSCGQTSEGTLNCLGYCDATAPGDESCPVCQEGESYDEETGECVPLVIEAGYEEAGYEEAGYEEAGYEEAGYDESFYDESGYDETSYDEAFYDEAGYEEAGYDESGYDEAFYDESGYDEAGYDEAFYDEAFYDESGYEEASYDESFYDESGYDESGYDESGYDESFYDESGYDESSYDEAFYDESGYDETSYDESGYDESGYDEAFYDESGYDESGYEEADYGG